jgi:hypothetical protein
VPHRAPFFSGPRAARWILRHRPNMQLNGRLGQSPFARSATRSSCRTSRFDAVWLSSSLRGYGLIMPRRFAATAAAGTGGTFAGADIIDRSLLLARRRASGACAVAIIIDGSLTVGPRHPSKFYPLQRRRSFALANSRSAQPGRSSIPPAARPSPP